MGITPDGPRGPRMRASIGVIKLAQLASVDIVPVAGSVSASKRANSWDQMVVPYPMFGSRGALLLGKLIYQRAWTGVLVACGAQRLNHSVSITASFPPISGS